MSRDGSVSFGFLLSGFLFSLPAALLPAWNYHLGEQYAKCGWLFLALGVGSVAAAELRRHFLQAVPTKLLGTGSAAAAACPLLLFGVFPSPVLFSIQATGLFCIGVAAGLLNVSLFESLRAAYRLHPAATVTRAGIYFGAGCLASAVIAALAFRFASAARLPFILAALPVVCATVFARSGFAFPSPDRDPTVREALREFSKPGAILFALLLLCQSGSEWTVAGWLPLFLTHRMGISPETALWVLSAFWLALLLGRAANMYLISRVRHSRMLLFSGLAALFGCLLLVFTTNLLGAYVAAGFLGGGFAAIYPLVAEKMGSRFPSYHPGVFNSIFSIAAAGGLLFPWASGLVASTAGLSAIMITPATGTFLVVVLLLVLWLESTVTGR